MPRLTINGRTQTDMDLGLKDWGDLYSRTGVTRDYLSVPGMLGAHAISRAEGRVKVIPVAAQLKNITSATRQAGIDAFLNSLRGLLEIERDDATDRVYWGIVDQAQIRNRIPMVSGDGPVLINFEITIPMAIAIAKEPTIVELVSGVRTNLVPGTAPSPLFIYTPGAASNPTYTYRGGNGLTLESLILDGSVPADRTIRIETGPWEIYEIDETTGVEVPAMSYFDETLTADNVYVGGGYPVLHPQDVHAGINPTLEASYDSYAIYWKAFE